jgi:hypothetical protein
MARSAAPTRLCAGDVHHPDDAEAIVQHAELVAQGCFDERLEDHAPSLSFW